MTDRPARPHRGLTMFFTAAVLAVLAVCGLIAATVAVFGGLYNVSATTQHTRPVYALLEVAMRQSVRLRSSNIVAPALDDPVLISRGGTCFVEKCLQCHGGPGVAQGTIGQSMQPVPGPLVDANQRWRPRELYWLTRNGIKMSGMPAWEFHMDDRDLWAVVAFLGRLPALSPQEFAAITAASADNAAWRPVGGAPAAATRDGPACIRAQAATSQVADIRRGEKAMYQYACNACHTIPGITGSASAVGPPLAGIARRSLIAGKLPNDRDNMARWLLDPKAIAPLTAMPAMGVSDRDARDMAAYLATLD